MRKSMKFLALILALIMIFPTVIFAQEEAEASAEISLTEDKYYNMLLAFGIVKEADGLENTQFLSRSLFAKYALSLFGPEVILPDVENSEPVFSDIIGDSNEAQITELYNRGLISGTAVGVFSPEAEVTMAQAAKVFVNALGFEKLAESRGGFPGGYVSVAGSKDILKGVAAQPDSPITTKAFLRMLFNALNADVLQLEGVTELDDEIFELSKAYKGESVLSELYDIHEFEGIFESDEYTSLYGKSEAEEGTVIIGGKTFKTNKAVWRDLLGCSVECFYKGKDEDVLELLYADINERDNEIVFINGADVDKDTVSLEKYSYYNEEKKKEYSYKISPVATLIYNGAQTEMTKEYMCPENGDVTLIDNDNDGKTDVIRVNDYITMFVREKAESTQTLLGDNGIALALESDVEEYGFYILKNNAQIGFKDINTGSVVSFTKPLDCSVRYIKNVIVSETKIEGSVESISTEDMEVQIGGTWYNYVSDAKIINGDKGTFFLDFRGTVVRYEAEKDFVYGYLFKLGEEKDSLRKKYGARILSEKGNLVTLNFAEKVKTNDDNKKDAKDVYDANANRKDEIIRYSVNEAGEIREIYFAETAEWFSAEHTELIENKVFHKIPDLGTQEYYNSAATFSGTVGLKNSTVVFLQPQGYEGVDGEKTIEVTDKSVLRNNTDYPYISAYDIDGGGTAAVAIIKNPDEYSASAGLVPVQKVVVCNNDDGEEVYAIRGYFSSNEIMTVCVTDDEKVALTAAGIKKGDLIRCNINKNNVITNIEPLFSPGKYGVQTWAGSASSRLVSGTVKSIDYVQKKFIVNSGSDLQFSGESVGSVWVYDLEEKEYRPGSIADIQQGDFVYLRAGSFVVREIVVFK